MPVATSFKISIPGVWQQCSRRQYRWLFRMLATKRDISAAELKAVAFLRFSRLQIIGHSDDRQSYLLQYGSRIINIDPEQFAIHLRHLDWILFPPTRPWRPARMACGVPCAADMSDLSFDRWLQVENLYQGYLATDDESLLRRIGRLTIRRRLRPLLRWELLAIFYWIASVKDFFAQRFPDFYAPVSDGCSLAPEAPSAEQLRQAVNAQIRALTKGDITREEEVLALPCHRALAELNAQAREYQELQKSMKK